MDCDKFDRAVLDFVYDELDELSRAAAQRHISHCQRCRDLAQTLQATREVARVPLLDVPSGFEAQIINLEQAAQRSLPITQRLTRAFTIAAGYTTRPQIAMAALLVLMVGSSLFFLRPRPGAHASVSVTERGVPRAEPETVWIPLVERSAAPVNVESAPHPSVALGAARVLAPEPSHPRTRDEELELDLATRKAEDRAYSDAMTAFQQGRFQEAQVQFDSIVDARGTNAAAAELYAALSLEAVSGCAASIPRFDSVSAHNPNRDLGLLATWHSATCRAQLGHLRRATLDLQKLATVPAYTARAKQALNRIALEAANDKHGRNREIPEQVDVLRGDAPSALPDAPKLPLPQESPSLSSSSKPAAPSSSN